MRDGCPARQAKRLGTYWTTTIGDKRVTLFKSDSHMSQDGPQLANAVVWKQIIEDSNPSLVITTGTGGGIGTDVEVGDVIVSRFISFDCQRELQEVQRRTSPARWRRDAQFKKAERCSTSTRSFAEGQQPSAEDHHAPPNAQNGRRSRPTSSASTPATTTTNCKARATSREMGDAVLGMVCHRDGRESAPRYSIVRNVSDPQIRPTACRSANRRRWRPTSTRPTAGGAPSAARSSAGPACRRARESPGNCGVGDCCYQQG